MIRRTYLGYSILICTHRSDDTQRPGVDLLTPIADVSPVATRSESFLRLNRVGCGCMLG